MNVCRQLQIHEKLNQGYLHFLSLTGPGAPIPDIVEATRQCAISWVENTRKMSYSLWDLDRMLMIVQNVGIEGRRINDFLHGFELLVALKEGTSVYWRMEAIKIRLYELMTQDNVAKDKINIENIETRFFAKCLENIMTYPVMSDMTSDQKESALLAADLVLTNEGHPTGAMKKLKARAKKIHKELGEAYVSGEPLKRTFNFHGEAVCTSIGRGTLEAMLHAVLEDTYTVSRCPWSLIPNVDGGKWSCRSCSRLFQSPPMPSHFTEHPPLPLMCPLCAGLVGPRTPDYFFTPPCG